jgi:hypothetical protein
MWNMGEGPIRLKAHPIGTVPGVRRIGDREDERIFLFFCRKKVT